MKTDIKDIEFEEIEIFGLPALYTFLRIDKSTLPQNIFVYEVRSDENGAIATLEKYVAVNFIGSIITQESIEKHLLAVFPQPCIHDDGAIELDMFSLNFLGFSRNFCEYEDSKV